MSTQNDYNVEDWKAISTAPLAVGLAILHADTSRSIPARSDLVLVGNAIIRTATGDAPEIVKVLVGNARSRNGGSDQRDLSHRREARTTLIEIVRRAVRAVAVQSPEEGEPFKTWLASIAARSFHARRATDPPSANTISRRPTDEETISRLADVLGICASESVEPALQHEPAAAPVGH